MTPKEKAKYLYGISRFYLLCFDSGDALKDLCAKEAALFVATEILAELKDLEHHFEIIDLPFHYWNEVKFEIEEL